MWEDAQHLSVAQRRSKARAIVEREREEVGDAWKSRGFPAEALRHREQGGGAGGGSRHDAITFLLSWLSCVHRTELSYTSHILFFKRGRER